MIVEKSMFELDISSVEAVIETLSPSLPARGCVYGWGRGHGQRGCGRGVWGKRGAAAYGIQHGQKRGTHSGTHDIIAPIDEPTTIDDAPGEGLYSYIQTTICRRAILTRIFHNTTPSK
jgi:hypothetical protein